MLASDFNYACVYVSLSIDKVTFSNAINKRTHFTLRIYFMDNLSAKPNQMRMYRFHKNN
jgi:hypothetical protein